MCYQTYFFPPFFCFSAMVCYNTGHSLAFKFLRVNRNFNLLMIDGCFVMLMHILGFPFIDLAMCLYVYYLLSLNFPDFFGILTPFVF